MNREAPVGDRDAGSIPLPADLPPTGTCDVSTRGRRSGKLRRIEIWYVVVDGRMVLTGTPGRRDWLANLRSDPRVVLHLRRPAADLESVAEEVLDAEHRRALVTACWGLQPWYAQQGYSVDDWVAGAPVVILVPQRASPRAQVSTT